MGAGPSPRPSLRAQPASASAAAHGSTLDQDPGSARSKEIAAVEHPGVGLEVLPAHPRPDLVRPQSWSERRLGVEQRVDQHRVRGFRSGTGGEAREDWGPEAMHPEDFSAPTAATATAQPGTASSGIDSCRSADGEDGSLSAVARVTWTFTTLDTRSTLPSA